MFSIMHKNLIVFSLFILLVFSCKKEEGYGGKASVQGFVWVKEYNSNYSILQLEREGYDEYVYINFGDEISYGDRIKTSYDGRFEFKYLRPGKYKIYCYSNDPSDKDNVKPDKTMVVLQEIEVTKKENKLTDTLIVYK